MEIGGLLLLVVILIVAAILGGGLYVLTMWLRGKQLHPQGDKVEGPRDRDERPRPDHVEVENEQKTRFVGTR
jgi:hypothetical protein